MLLRSSSTPVLGSPVSSISDQSPNHHHYHPELPNHNVNIHHPTTVLPQCLNKLSFHQGGSQSFTFSCNSSPISPSISELSFGRSSTNGFRRAQSEGNLEGLTNTSSDIDEFSFSKPIKKFTSRSSGSFLETIPSFSFHKSSGKYEDDSEYEEDDDEEDSWGNQDQLVNHSIRNDVDNLKFGFNEEMKYVSANANVGLQKEIDNQNSQMYVARGLGIFGVDMNFGGSNGSYGGNGGFGGGNRSEDGDEKDLEKHYKKMVQDNPGNPLCLRNYAQFLYQTKNDLQGAEEYYCRAILIDPNDGEILSQYAKLVWELHNDKDRATGYFERAVQAASEDSFLWETEDEDEDDDTLNDSQILPPAVHRGAMASATAQY
ncbi:uncharacterized protein LOC141707611 isoform X2 [Apium graveolens]|uniref:uncharacterized protein LOC141707611 isoform X2 n=1 Tax=Apium graveolens TaxID=4045 RepID=UPI003D794152